MSKARAIAERAAWTFVLTFATAVAVLQPLEVWTDTWIKAAAGSAVVAAASAVKNALATPPEARK